MRPVEPHKNLIIRDIEMHAEYVSPGIIPIRFGHFRAIEPQISSGEATDMVAMDELWEAVKRGED